MNIPLFVFYVGRVFFSAISVLDAACSPPYGDGQAVATPSSDQAAMASSSSPVGFATDADHGATAAAWDNPAAASPTTPPLTHRSMASAFPSSAPPPSRHHTTTTPSGYVDTSPGGGGGAPRR